MNYLKEILTNKVPNIKTLPILHSCEAFNVESILDDGILKTTLCDVFNEDYLYAFYGIPSYRKKMDKSTGIPGYYPVCFIFNYDKIQNLNKLHPCDTGAFEKLESVKKDHFHDQIYIENLELAPDINEAKKLIDKFYKKNDNYIRHKPQVTTSDIGVKNSCAWGYTSLINDKSSTDYDNRIATIELIFEKEILINENNLIQIIVPATYLDEPDIYKLITKKYKITDPLVYESIKGTPNENFGAIYNLYLTFVRQNKLS